MKKFIVIILFSILIFCFSGCVLEDACYFYRDTAEMDNFTLAMNKVARCCFVGKYHCTEYADYYEITIPDHYKGMPIISIGGYSGRGVPTPFFIDCSDVYMNAPEDSKYDTVFSGNISKYENDGNYTIQPVVFKLNIGKNIKEVELVVMDNYYPHINEDGSITFYHPVVEINCADENKFFYSQDGKLYDKETDELISDFAYIDDCME